MADDENRDDDFDLGDQFGAEEEKAEDEVDDPELEAMKQKVKEMEEEARKLNEMQSQVEKSISGATSIEDKEEIDSRSVYVGNVDYGTTPEELQAHFASCGAITRVTILCDTYTGHPKGFAYVEFSDKGSVDNALVLDESVFRGRQLKVMPKRTNVPGLKMRSRGRGRPAFGGGFRGGYGGYGGYAPRPRARFRCVIKCHMVIVPMSGGNVRVKFGWADGPVET